MMFNNTSAETLQCDGLAYHADDEKSVTSLAVVVILQLTCLYLLLVSLLYPYVVMPRRGGDVTEMRALNRLCVVATLAAALGTVVLLARVLTDERQFVFICRSTKLILNRHD